MAPHAQLDGSRTRQHRTHAEMTPLLCSPVNGGDPISAPCSKGSSSGSHPTEEPGTEPGCRDPGLDRQSQCFPAPRRDGTQGNHLQEETFTSPHPTPPPQDWASTSPSASRGLCPQLPAKHRYDSTDKSPSGNHRLQRLGGEGGAEKKQPCYKTRSRKAAGGCVGTSALGLWGAGTSRGSLSAGTGAPGPGTPHKAALFPGQLWVWGGCGRLTAAAGVTPHRG